MAGWLVELSYFVGDEHEMDVVFEGRLGGGIAADPTAERARRTRGEGEGVLIHKVA